VRTTRNIIIRLPILRCKPLQPKGIVPVLVLLRMTDSDSDIHSRRPLFWVPVDGRSFGTPPLKQVRGCRCGELSTGGVLPRLSSTESFNYSDLLVTIAATFRVRHNSAVQRLAKHSRTSLGSAGGSIHTYSWGSLVLCIPGLPES
jgi:hypothetical protein